MAMPAHTPDATPPPHNSAVAIEFLERWQPNASFVSLSSIPPDGPIQTRCFALPEESEAASSFIEARQGVAGIYFTVNVQRERADRKPSKLDIAVLRSFHVDLDPRPSFDLTEERTRIQSTAAEFHPKPTVLIDSGGGFQAFWRLAEPVPVDGNVELLEGFNRRLAVALGGDSCWNIDRIMRVPGTVNLPNAKKQADGRVPTGACLIWFEDDLTYTLDDFQRLPEAVSSESAVAPVETVAVSKEMPERLLELIDPDHPSHNAALAELWAGGPRAYNDDRSRFDFALGMRLISLDFSDPDIAAALCGYPESKALQRGSVYTSRTIAKARREFSRTRSNLTFAAKQMAPTEHHTGQAAHLPEFSDEALALRFAECYEADLRYVAAWGKWFLWDGKRWAIDDTMRAFDLSRLICRTAAAECNESSRKQLASAKTVNAVQSLARADRRLAATTDQWDADPWLLNTPEGVVDLRDGRPREHLLDDYMTKRTAVSPEGQCPMWKAFLGRITAGDFGLQEYLKRLTGYALTGLTREHVLAFLYGTGANGKSVFINTISGVLGDYATTAPMEAFVASKTEHHPTELAMLRAARLVTATETEEGRRWAESKIKALTGGDAITARFMRQDFFTFTPQFTLIVAGNHKPGLRNVDEAMRRRLHLVPFTVTIPEDLRDDQLAEKLKVEWPGILQWMVEGAVEWGRSGLQPPKTVRTATAAYLQAEDAIAAWIEERCTTKADDFASNGALFRSWSDWATKAGEYVGKKTRLTQALEDRSFERTKATGGVRGFRGIAVKPTESDNWYDR